MNNSRNDKSDEIDLSRLIGELIDGRWIIIYTTAVFLILGILYCLFSTPIYRADALVQIEQNTGNRLLNSISQVIPNDQPASVPEIELLKSRMILGKTIEDLNLRNVIEQEYFPVFGKGFARLTKQHPGKLVISTLEVLSSWEDDPSLKLIVSGKNSFVIEREGNEIAKGNAGVLLKKDGLSLLVSSIDATPGTVFKITKPSELQAINEILFVFNVADVGKNTGVLKLTLTGEDRTLIRKILNVIVDNYLAQNIARKSAQDEKSLGFLNEQLPKVRSALDSSENTLSQYRQKNDSVDLSLEAKSILESIVSVENQLNELTFKEAEISKLFTKQHPAYRALLEKRKTLEIERAKLNKRVSNMPQTQQEILRLSRDVQSSQDVYMHLLNKEQELSISKASTVGNVRIIDSAVTQIKVVQPKKTIAIALSIVLGAMLSIGYILFKCILHKGIENTQQLEELGIKVYASIPFSEWQRKKDLAYSRKNKGNKKDGDTDALLAFGNAGDLSMEAIRGLRTSLHFIMMEAKNNVLMISGPNSGVGKTYISANLAAVFAQSEKKVLFIDSDLRKGYAHELMGVTCDKGLSEILSGKITKGLGIRSTSHNNLDFLPRGQRPAHPSELLMHPRFSDLIMEVSKEYDLVLIDTPPILAVTDAAIIGESAGTSLMVAKFESNTPKEVEVSVKRFLQNGIEIKGVVINAVIRRAANLYSYHYDYKYQNVK